MVSNREFQSFGDIAVGVDEYGTHNSRFAGLPGGVAEFAEVYNRTVDFVVDNLSAAPVDGIAVGVEPVTYIGGRNVVESAV